MNLSPLPIQKFFANNGRPLAGGLLFTYVAGTDTKVATYVDANSGAQNTNPIVLDFRGECRLWIDPQQAYKFVLSPPGDTDPPTRPIWTVDDITVAPQAFDNAAVDTGSVNNISLNIPQISSPVAFTRVVFKAAHTNTGPTTLQINGGTALPVTWQSAVSFSGNEIIADGIYEAIFDGGSWQLQGPTLSPCDLRLYGGIPDGTTDATAALIAASAASALGRGPIVITGGTYRISSSLSIARGAEVHFNGGILSIDSGRVVTFNGAVIAPRARIFAGVGTVSIAFGGEAAVTVYPEWWGAIPDGITDCSAAINAAILASPQCIIQFGAAVYMADNILLGTANSLYGVSKDETIIVSRTATWLVRLTNVGITKCQLTIKDITFDGGGVGTNGLELINAAHFSIRDCKITGFTLRGVYSQGSIIYQIVRTEILTCDVGFDAISAASHTNLVTLQQCQIGGCPTYAVRVRGGSLFLIDNCDIEANGIGGNNSTRAIDVANMDTDGLGISLVIKDTWFENNSGLAAIRIGAPASAYSKHIIDGCQILGGTRLNGIATSDGPPFNAVHIVRSVAQNASVADISIGTNCVGSMIDSRASSVSVSPTNTDFLMLSNPANGEYRLGNNFRLSAAGNVTLPVLPTTTSYANDAAAAAGGVAIGQLYRNGSIVQVRVT